jgi:L-aminopeptidase/D-esterase-like protein
MHGLKVGHYTQSLQGTGVSVFLFTHPAVAAYCLCGASPATFDLNVLDLEAHVTHIDALVFLGGSALGLPAVKGVQDWLLQHNRGWPVDGCRIPIVPAVALYDLAIQSTQVPQALHAKAACENATSNNHDRGQIGAGTGASIGKLLATANRARGGLGFAHLRLTDNIEVSVYVAVNCVGDVLNRDGSILAGATLDNGDFLNTAQALQSLGSSEENTVLNTTLVAIITTARFSKTELHRIAKMASAGMARAISPIFTRFDGDIIFAVSVGTATASETQIGAIAADLTHQAIINSVL